MTRTRKGVIASVVYLLIVGFLAWPKLCTLRGLDPNQIGDFLGGSFGPLAFLWLVLGYLQQSDQLKLNSDELILNSQAVKQQAEEVAESIKQQKKLLEINQKQLEASLSAIEIEREKIKEQQRKEEISSQPQFNLFDIKPVFHNERQVSTELQLTNFGADCTQLSIHGYSTPPTPDYIAIFKNGQQISVEFGTAGSPSADHMLFRYTDKNGLRKRTLLKVYYTGTGGAGFEKKLEALPDILNDPYWPDNLYSL